MTREEFVGELIEQAKPNWDRFWSLLPDEERLRLSGIESVLAAIGRELRQRFWQLAAESLEALAAELEGMCQCGHRRERRKDTVHVDVLGERV